MKTLLEQKSLVWRDLSLQEGVRCMIRLLQAVGIQEAPREAWLLLEKALETPLETLLQNPGRRLTPEEGARLEATLSRRLRREPLAYVLEEREFWGLSFWTPPGVFIPRPETEGLVEAVLGLVPQDQRGAPWRILDLGTGSGCLAISLAVVLPQAKVVGVDCSEQALVVAQQNAHRHGVATRIQWVRGNWAMPFKRARIWDFILSNPPYIPPETLPSLEPEVGRFEPREALDGGEDGLEAYGEILPQAAALLRSGGWLLLEVGWGQAEAVCGALREIPGFAPPRVVPDLAGCPRVVQCQYRG